MYKHKPLSPGRNIRTLILQPNKDFDAPIQITLKEIVLPADKKVRCNYEALSYVWGAKVGDQSISCEGGELLVTKNCLDALRFLRLRTKSRILWIDAICIDQVGTTEKVHQIKMMGDVFAQARRVVAWLGYGDSDIESLMKSSARRAFIVESMPRNSEGQNKLLRRIFGFRGSSYERKWLLGDISNLRKAL